MSIEQEVGLMGDVSSLPSVQEIFLLPEQVVTDDKYQGLRGWTGNEEEEAKEIERLAVTIERDGQLDSALVTPGKGGSYVLIAGHRRRRAVAMINERRSQSHAGLLKLRCRIEVDGDLKQKAIISNVQRKGFTAMDLAGIIKGLREDKGWEGFPGAKKIAAYLGIDPATVTQHERFLTASKEIQQALHAGTVSTASALELLNVKDEKHAEILGRADEIQAEKAKRLTPKAKAVKEAKEVKEPKPKKTQTDSASIRQAIREKPEVVIRAIPLSKKELLEQFEQLDSPVYGHPDGAVRQWVNYLCYTFAAGKGTVETLRKKFDTMTKGANRGTEPKADVGMKLAAPVVLKSLTGKAKRADAGMTKKPKAEKPEKVAKPVKPAKAKKPAAKKPAKSAKSVVKAKSKKKAA